MSEQLRIEMERLIARERLPASFYSLAALYYLPLADCIAESFRLTGKPRIIGINGAQGTGKSTLGQFLALFLEHKYQLRCATLSLDDVYLTHAERQDLAHNVHPLLATRGVPGTHDLALGISVCQQLLAATDDCHTLIPRFNKAMDDRYPQEQWTQHDGRVDILLFEGWCVGNRPQPPDTITKPINQLEQSEDSNGRWRRYVNTHLQYYQRWFSMLDQLIMLKAPSMEAVYQWRCEQEEKLAENTKGSNNRIMSTTEIHRFIQHYERLTRYALLEMPRRADCVFHLNESHNIVNVSGPLVQNADFRTGTPSHVE